MNQETSIVECCNDEVGGVAQSLNRFQVYGKQPQEIPDAMNDDYNTQRQQKKVKMSTRNKFFMSEDLHSVERCDRESGCSSVRQSDDNIPSEPHMLPEPSSCIHCGALKFYKETKGFCCSDGQVSLKIYDMPQELRTLFTSNSEECVSFKTCVRSYNCNFAMTSFGVHYDKDLCANYNGIYTFRIQGQVYHFVNEILPSDNRPSYMQLYYFDTDNEIQNRLNLSEKLEQSVVAKLVEIVKTNPYVNFFRSLSTYSDLENRSIRIRCDTTLDQRTYNIPTVSQVAAMWVDGDDCTDINMRDIIVHCKDGKTHRIQYYFGCYDPLQYPLLFPYGESGWHQGIQRIDVQNKNEAFCKNQDIIDVNQLCSAEDLIEKETKVSAKKKARMQVSCREYYCYKLQVRPRTNSILLHTGRLLQQFVVDMYVKIETSRLDYIRHHQSELRAELYQGIVDSLEKGENRGNKIGLQVVLPKSFTGAPRDMRTRYLNALALVQKFGKPDIFLTMTCNPNWQEIKEQLKYNDEAQNRPDLVVRIFKAKLEELKQDILKRNIFGSVVAYICVIEFQKRGLPHVHFLLILRKDVKVISPDLVDKFVSAEIPDENNEPYLHSLVAKHMMHGPCGTLNRQNVCMKNKDKCKFDFPKIYSEETVIDKKCFPRYKRPNNNRKLKVRKHFLDNRWVVPYNRYLLAKFNCHINVEICSSIQAVKYLYKYVYKGHDKISFSVDTNDPESIYDEIKMYQSARWVSPPESVWRIFEFPLYDMNPSVISLQLHLENHQCITYKECVDLENIVQFDFFQRTMLTEYFHMNILNPKARTLLYRDFPDHFVWDTKGKLWNDRKRKTGTIGRIVAVNIAEGERYYLRKLLNHVRGATSYENLKFVNGVHAVSFREAALLHGLLNGDTDCEMCFEEASQYQMPNTLRQLFATVLTLCDPHDPKKLWNKFKHHMIEDYIQHGMCIESAETKALHELNELLQPFGKTINDYHLVQHKIISEEKNCLAIAVTDHLKITISDEDLSCANQLNIEQKNAYDMILQSVMANKSAMFFVDGPGGTGKTFLYRALLATIRSRGMIALATASSGVATGLLPKGRTAHSQFKIPLQISNESTCSKLHADITELLVI